MTISPRVVAAIEAHAEQERPRECCGLLLGSATVIVEAIATRNLAAQPTRYLIDPVAHFAVIRAARDRGLDVVGAYHSHVESPARPSATDRAEAFSGFLFVIVSLATPAPDLTAWELEDGNFVPVSLVATA